MKICTFFGHRDAPDDLKPRLRQVITELIESGQADTFYVGNQGRFDAMALAVLTELAARYPIRYAVVLAYMPTRPVGAESFLPDGIETAPKRFAISYRNRWMADHADIAVTYVRTACGGAAQGKKRAVSRGKTVIELA